MIKKRLIIGTSQFDKDYAKCFGKKKSEKSNFTNIRQMLNYAYKNEVFYLDSAMSYKNSDNYISKINKKFKIITKLPKVPLNKKDYNIYFEKIVKKKLKKMNLKKFWAILFHDSNFLKSNKKEIIISAIQNLKIKNFCNKIGVSIYEKKDIDMHLKNWTPDIIELPYSVFDIRLNDNFLKKLKKKNIFLIARSIFLQGLILNSKFPNYFNKWKKKIYLWKKWCDKQKISRLEAAVSFILQKTCIDKFIVGLEDKDQLKEILKIKFKKNVFRFPNLNIKDKKILNPYYWRT